MTMPRRLRWTQLVRGVKRILCAAVAIVTGLLYLWFAAVRSVPRVRRRKARARAGKHG